MLISQGVFTVGDTFYQTSFQLLQPSNDFLKVWRAARLMFDGDPHIGYSPTGNKWAWTGVTFRAMDEIHFRPRASLLKIPFFIRMVKGQRHLMGGGFLFMDGREPIMDAKVVQQKWEAALQSGGFLLREGEPLIDQESFGYSHSGQDLVVTYWNLIGMLEVADPCKAAETMVHGVGDARDELGMGMLQFMG